MVAGRGRGFESDVAGGILSEGEQYIRITSSMFTGGCVMEFTGSSSGS